MIIAGTVIGAGMLANPTATSGIWFSGAIVVLLYTWFSMLCSGLMILEVNTHYRHDANFDTMVKDLLGQSWNIINGLAVAFVLYLLIYAYIFVGGSLTAQALGGINPIGGQLAFCLFFAGFVWYSAYWVDRLTAILIGGMVITFFWASGSLLGSAQIPILLDSNNPNGTYWPYLGAALPVCLASFGFHGNVSSLYKYFHGNALNVAKSLLLGTLLALFVYILWQLAIQGNLPRHAFEPVIAAEGDVGVLIRTLSAFVSTGHMMQALSLFSYMAIASSFLGVSLGLFDYLADLLSRNNSLKGRSQTAALTFLPPLIACLFFPTGFTVAIAYVGLAAAIWAVIIPALMLIAARKRFGRSPQYTLFGGRWLIAWVLIFGLLNIVAQLLSRAGMLPVFTG